jgi:CheY-like chemotaxis protein
MDLASLLTLQGMEVVSAVAGVREALAYVAAGDFDCALLDINLGEEECGPVADALRDAAFPSYS